VVGIILALIAAGGWGAGAVLTRVGISGVRISIGVLVSLAASLTVIACAAAVLDWPGMEALSPSTLGWFAMTGLVGYPLGRQLNFRSISFIGAARATPIMSSSPLFAILFAVIFTGEIVTIPQIAGALMIVAGLAVVVSSDPAVSGGRANSGGGAGAGNRTGPRITRAQYLGYGFALAAGVAYGLNNVLIKQGLNAYKHPLWGASIALTSGTLMLLFISLPALRNIAADRRRGLLVLLAAGVSSAVGVACSYTALSLAPVSVVSPVTATFPLWTLLGVRLFLARSERVSWLMVIGAALVVAGVSVIAVTK
jgi:drug/metabolite transporter, DME family